MKYCKRCENHVNEEDFLKSGSECKSCNCKYMREYRKKRLETDPEFKKREQQRQKDWWENNRGRGNERQRNYRKDNIKFQLSNALRARVKYALIGCAKSEKTFELLGCSPQEWKDYLENLFNDNMNWDNYGTYWEVDHIIPVSHFDLNDEDEQKRAFHYLNTQPLEVYKNRTKGNRWIG